MSNPVSRRMIAIGTAAVAGLAVWSVARLAIGADPAVRTGGAVQSVGPVAVVLTALVVGLAGWGLAALLDRITRRGRLIWTVIASVVLVVSLLGPLGGVDNASRLTLALLHLAVGGVLIAGLARQPAARR